MRERDIVNLVEKYEFPGMLGPGDDAALLSEHLLVTLDTLVAGIHFEEDVKPSLLARKLVRVNVSDIAAMGGRPSFAFLSLALKTGFDTKAFMISLQRECRTLDIVLMGGDTVQSSCTVLSLTLLGEKSPYGLARRDAAEEGDVVFVTGALGGAVVSGRHLSPPLRLDEASFFLEKGLCCLMDLSDGLSNGIATLAAQSEKTIEVSAQKIPFHDDTKAWNFEKRLNAALHEGEDFELLGTASKEVWEKISQGPYSLFKIGSVRKGKGVFIENKGQVNILEDKGFEHQC
jgi:thiamine-monophosphate kinase